MIEMPRRPLDMLSAGLSAGRIKRLLKNLGLYVQNHLVYKQKGAVLTCSFFVLKKISPTCEMAKSGVNCL
jgi:hypothetical protein